MIIILEFYSVQADPDDPGVLVLSLLAGIADEMKQPLLANPHDLDGVADATATATATAANMPRCERIERWPAMMQYLRGHAIHRWRNTYLQAQEGG